MFVIVSGKASIVPRKDSWTACDPIAPAQCMSPFPNSFYLVDNKNTNTGYQVNLTNEMLFNGMMDPLTLRLNNMDGFAVGSTLMVVLPSTPLLTDAATWANISVSLQADSPTLLLAVKDGKAEKVAHWVELDIRSPNEDIHRTLLIHPAEGMQPGVRYIVALRNIGVATSDAFAWLRSKTSIPSSIPSLVDRREQFEGIFTYLSNFGWERSSVTLSWDFVTESDESLHKKLLFLRKDSLVRVPKSGVRYVIDSTEEKPNDSTLRMLNGRMEVPLYLDSPDPGSHLVLDAQGLPQFQGFTNVSFMVRIPITASEDSPKPLIHVGHGLFGDRTELLSDNYVDLANQSSAVMASVDWWGLTEQDQPLIGKCLQTNLSDFNMVPDRLHQSVVNQLYLTKLFELDAILNDIQLKGPKGKVLVDPSVVHYTGSSLGGIMGSTFVAVSPKISKAVLGVAGSPFDMLMVRSIDFVSFYAVLSNSFQPSEVIFVISILENLMNFVTPSAYLRHLVDNTFDAIPKQIILQNSLADGQVPMVGAYGMARSLKAKVFPNTIREYPDVLSSFTEVDSPYEMKGNSAVFQIWDFKAQIDPFGDLAPTGYDTHGCVRRDYRGMKQLIKFFETGMVYNYCDPKNGCLPTRESRCNYGPPILDPTDTYPPHTSPSTSVPPTKQSDTVPPTKQSDTVPPTKPSDTIPHNARRDSSMDNQNQLMYVFYLLGGLCVLFVIVVAASIFAYIKYCKAKPKAEVTQSTEELGKLTHSFNQF